VLVIHVCSIEFCNLSSDFLWNKVEPNQEFQGLVCEGANVLPAKFLENSMRDGYGNFFFILHIHAVVSHVHVAQV